MRKAVDGVKVRDPQRIGRWRKASGLGATERDSTGTPSRDVRDPRCPQACHWSEGPRGGKPEGNRPQGRHRGCGPYRLHGPGECGSQAALSQTRIQSGARIGLPGGSGSRGSKAHGPRPGAMNLVQGSKGGRRLWSMGSRGERSLLLVVVQRRSVWSGRVSGGAGTPPPERMKRRTFL